VSRPDLLREMSGRRMLALQPVNFARKTFAVKQIRGLLFAGALKAAT
jgi:hypothetical protein